jgi:hypothetical protein
MQRTGWRRWAVFLLRALAILLVVLVAGTVATVAVARALLPTTCAVSEAQFDGLSMQMKYDKAKELLGCDGVLVSKEDYGQIVIERYAWRGDAWPYGRVRLEFINGTLQGTEKRWLNLSLGLRT